MPRLDRDRRLERCLCLNQRKRMRTLRRRFQPDETMCVKRQRCTCLMLIMSSSLEIYGASSTSGTCSCRRGSSAASASASDFHVGRIFPPFAEGDDFYAAFISLDC